MKHDGNKFVHI